MSNNEMLAISRSVLGSATAQCSAVPRAADSRRAAAYSWACWRVYGVGRFESQYDARSSEHASWTRPSSLGWWTRSTLLAPTMRGISSHGHVGTPGSLESSTPTQPSSSRPRCGSHWRTAPSKEKPSRQAILREDQLPLLAHQITVNRPLSSKPQSSSRVSARSMIPRPRAYAAHPRPRGRGIMLRALTLLLDWGFEDKGLLTVIWWANKGNWSSRRIAWRLGFSFDGAVRQWLPQRGRLLDGWVGVLLSSEPGVPTCPWLEIPRIVGAKSVLRVHQPKDDGRVQEACSDERASYWLSNLPTPYTPAVSYTHLTLPTIYSV